MLYSQYRSIYHYDSIVHDWNMSQTLVGEVRPIARKFCYPFFLLFAYLNSGKQQLTFSSLALSALHGPLINPCAQLKIDKQKAPVKI